MPLKIAVVVPKYGLVGGGEHFASEVTERLARNQNLEIHVFANRWIVGSDRITFHKIPKVVFPRFLGPLVFAWYVGWKVGRMKFDLVHSHHWIFNADIFSAHGVPHIGWVRDVRHRSPSLYDRAVIYIERRIMGKGINTQFLPVSNIAMEQFRKEYSALPGRWEVVHPGVDVGRFSLPDRSECRTEIRGRYGIGQTDILLLFVGMNFEVKGLAVIMAALAKAKNLEPERNFRLLVVGRGNRAKFHKLAETLGIADSVIFAGTQIDGLERYYRAADIFIMLSAFDTFGMVVLEAMAAGLPVIVSSNVGAKDLVEEGVNGFILEAPVDVDAGANRIALLSKAELRETMGIAASEVASRHDWEILAERIQRMYQVANKDI
jgi:UDP-glucose:(heptosyl)LPS alpha-1,3-glucosyltransferase